MKHVIAITTLADLKNEEKAFSISWTLQFSTLSTISLLTVQNYHKEISNLPKSHIE